jgi:hypothetical protein
VFEWSGSEVNWIIKHKIIFKKRREGGGGNALLFWLPDIMGH